MPVEIPRSSFAPSRRRATNASRRRFLQTTAVWVAGGLTASRAAADERPPVTRPRATSGDDRVEPAWDERLTITVGQREADIVGRDERALQAAVDYVARLGGGTVKILPGEYVLSNAVYLRSKVRLVGAGEETVLAKAPSVTTKLAEDSDWYDQEITLADARGFKVGSGVCIRTRNPHNGGLDVAKRTLVARSGNRFKLDRALRQNFWLMGDTTVSTLHALLDGEEVEEFAIENLALDGRRAENENLDGNYAGCIFLQDCRRIDIRGVTARNNNGDGISWQICHDVVVENCHSHGHAGLALHPGSGSQRPLIRHNQLADSDIGIFFCWGVKYGLAEQNEIRGNRVGVSIGHRDTDNLVRRNTIAASRENAVLFRPERGKDFAGHRNRIEENKISDTGPAGAVAIDVQGQTETISITANEIHESRGAEGRIGVRLGAETRDITLAQNEIHGLAVPVEDLRKS
ncbi:MAG: right-handed parallel beta-helix repeat-containing protein [Pirellulales bacterium]|nr:right-handed parallel beta-helix repeat-containing protein [Pirellulales bacterium]